MQLQQKGLQIQQKKAELEQENKHAYFRKKNELAAIRLVLQVSWL